MPKIKFKLKDPKFCNGCPYFVKLNFYYNCKGNCGDCDTIECSNVEEKNCEFAGMNDLFPNERPQACIDKFGE